MRKLLLLLFSLPILVCSQEKQGVEDTIPLSLDKKSDSRSVEFANRGGVLIKKEYVDIGKESGIEFTNVYITDVSTGEEIKSLRLLIKDTSLRYIAEYTGMLDSDEIDSCIKSLEYIKELSSGNLPDTYTELIYMSKDKVTIGAYCTIGKFAKWSLFIKSDYYKQGSLKGVDIKNIDKLINLFKLSMQKINKL